MFLVVYIKHVFISLYKTFSGICHFFWKPGKLGTMFILNEALISNPCRLLPSILLTTSNCVDFQGLLSM